MRRNAHTRILRRLSAKVLIELVGGQRAAAARCVSHPSLKCHRHRPAASRESRRRLESGSPQDLWSLWACNQLICIDTGCTTAQRRSQNNANCSARALSSRLVLLTRSVLNFFCQAQRWRKNWMLFILVKWLELIILHLRDTPPCCFTELDRFAEGNRQHQWFLRSFLEFDP